MTLGGSKRAKKIELGQEQIVLVDHVYGLGDHNAIHKTIALMAKRDA